MVKLIFLLFLLSVRSCSSINDTDKKLPAIHEPELQGQDTLSWYRPRFKERKTEREALVRKGIENYPYHPVKNKKVLDAMRAVPRHLFVPPNAQRQAYGNHPLSIGYGQTISQPLIVAHMTELLNIKPGDKILEIGTGSGYQAAVLSELTPNVYSIEIVEELGKIAIKRFQNLGYNTIKVKIGDGYFGWKEYAPFDGIIVTCAPENIPQSLINQLKPGGKIVIPVGGVNQLQILVVVEKDQKGNLRKKKQYPVRFVPMTGKAMEK